MITPEQFFFIRHESAETVGDHCKGVGKDGSNGALPLDDVYGGDSVGDTVQQ